MGSSAEGVRRLSSMPTADPAFWIASSSASLSALALLRCSAAGSSRRTVRSVARRNAIFTSASARREGTRGSHTTRLVCVTAG